MKAFFEEAAPLMHAEPLDLQALTAVNARHATTVVGPPLAAGAVRSETTGVNRHVSDTRTGH
jgi:hypothetical protein